jgi:hypothetical protein
VRFAGSAPLLAGDHCCAVAEGGARCGPPGPVGLVVEARAGDGDDIVFARVAHVAPERIALGRGDDLGLGYGLMVGGPGSDDLRVVRGGATFHGGRGADVLLGGRFRDLRRPPRRDDRLRARRLGVAGLSVYASGHMSRLADLRLLLLLPLRGE